MSQLTEPKQIALPVQWQTPVAAQPYAYMYLLDAQRRTLAIGFPDHAPKVAAFAVVAINNHDKLVEALGALANAVSDAADGGISDEQLLATTQRAMDLLEKIEQEKRANPATL